MLCHEPELDTMPLSSSHLRSLAGTCTVNHAQKDGSQSFYNDGPTPKLQQTQIVPYASEL